ncbi:glycoside hydrolase family protein [Mangrovibacterium lignilyticum]|uniref:beta-L-arabinofuranosidase domain-containing protein n=1 Tax=Mangrovibacterium lignilyticum TaxID=2668052 RepID=UPI0013D80F29|nr:beta-L-arabinofuranosidase domain-containing protein [Mangrovibacterium lignilyticum]
MKPKQFLLTLLLLSFLAACKYRTAPEQAGSSDTIPQSEISLGGVLAEKTNGLMPLDSANSARQPIAIEGILNLQEKVGQMVQQRDPTISDSLLGEWETMRGDVALNFENLADADLQKWTELNDSLLKYTGLVCFADELEKVFFNSQSPGVVTEDAVKSVSYTRRYDRIYVNIYNNSTLDFEHTTGGKIRLIQDTSYPNDGRITFRVEIEDTRYMDLYVRIPEWSKISAVTVKGVKYPVHPGQYTEIAKKWKNGDEVEVILGLRPEVVENEQGQFAFTYGPLFLTYIKDSTLVSGFADTDPIKYLQFVSPPGKMPTFTFSGIIDHTLVLQPFYAEKENGTSRTVWIPKQ